MYENFAVLVLGQDSRSAGVWHQRQATASLRSLVPHFHQSMASHHLVEIEVCFVLWVERGQGHERKPQRTDRREGERV